MVDNYRYEILTPTGFKSFTSIRKLIKPECLELTLSTGKLIRCSMEHPFIIDGNITLAQDLYIGCSIDSASHIPVYITDICAIDEPETLYDIINVADGNLFYVDGVVTHNCSFETSGHTVLETQTISYYENKAEDPIERRGPNGDIWIWSYPDYTKSYIVSADVARGDGDDYSTFHVIDIASMHQVAEYRGKIDTQTFGHLLVTISTDYNEALLVIDNRNIGWSSIQVAIDRGYRNLFYSYKNDPYVDPEIQLKKGYDLMSKENMVPGFTLTPRNRPMLISKMEHYCREQQIALFSKRLVGEFYTFVWENGKPQAASGYNDDLVMALAIALYVRDTAMAIRQQGLELIRKTMGAAHKGVYKPTNSRPGLEIGVGNKKENIGWLL